MDEFGKRPARRRVYDGVMKGLVLLGAGLTIALLVALIGYILVRGLPHVTWQLLSTSPSMMKGTIGILPNILNTLYLILFTLLISLPLGVGAAVYLTEYAKNRRFAEMVEFATETLAGIPSILYGLVGMLFFTQTDVQKLYATSREETADASLEQKCAAIARMCRLTNREAEVLVLLARGRTVRYICDELSIAQGTAKHHVSNIYRKVGVFDRQGLLDTIEQGGVGKPGWE
mgnify:CR=1 FL=1